MEAASKKLKEKKAADWKAQQDKAAIAKANAAVPGNAPAPKAKGIKAALMDDFELPEEAKAAAAEVAAAEEKA